MAGRTSTSIGVGVTVGVLGVACLALFVLAIVFLSKYQATNKSLNDLNAQTESIVLSSERNSDEVRRVADEAKKNRKSAMRHLMDSQYAAMQRITGVKTDSIDVMEGKVEDVKGPGGTPLLQVIRDRDSDIKKLQGDVGKAETDLRAALADLENENQRVEQLNKSHEETLATLNDQLDRYKGEVDEYRQAVNDSKRFMDEQISRLTVGYEEEKARLNGSIRTLTEQNLQLSQQVSELRGKRGESLLRPADEFALVDGEVIGLDAAEDRVIINLGSRNKVVLGMSFAVYAEASAIRPDSVTGEYPRGKATIEVMNVGADSAVCKVLPGTGVRGNPVVKGDVIANAVYDPKKTYAFLVFGNFDANGDGRATPQEQVDLRAMVESWGGKVVDDLAGDLDFLVLGQRPILGPPPAADAPIEIVRERIRQEEIVRRFDYLFQQAAATSIPVLNENRLYTLIGKR